MYEESAEKRKIDLSKLGDGGSILSKPLIYNNTVYFGSADNYFYALWLDGKLLWEYRAGGKILSNPALAEIHGKPAILFGSYDRYLYALSLDGQLIWRFETGGIAHSPFVYKDVIYFGSCDNYLYALTLSGEMKWRFRAGGEVFTCPAVSDDKIYFGSGDQHFYCLALDGKMLWRFMTGDQLFYQSPALVWNNNVYFGSMDQNLYCLTLDGKGKWVLRTGDWVNSNGTVHNDILYWGARDKHVYALDPKTGKLVWKFETNGPISSTVTIHEGRIYFGNGFPDSSLYCMTPDGKLLWKFTTNYSIVGSPAVYENNIYFGTWGGYFYAVSLEGKEIWRFEARGRVCAVADALPPPRPLGAWPSMFGDLKSSAKKIFGATGYDKTETEALEGIGVEYGSVARSYVTGTVTAYERSGNEKERESGERRKRLEEWMRRTNRM